MSETSGSQPPSEQPLQSAPAPGVRIRPPGAAPRLPDPDANEQRHSADDPSSPSPTSPPAADSQPDKPKATRREKAAAGDSSDGRGSRSQAGPTTATTSTTGSTDPRDGGPERELPPPVFVEPTQLAADLAGLLLAASEQANDKFAPETPLLLADEHEAIGVARPAARIIVRHMPAGMGGPGNPDLADAVSAAITLFRYGLRQLRLFHAIRRARATGPEAQQEAETMHPGPADPLLHPVA